MEGAQERKPKRPHYIPRPPGKPFKYQCFQCPFTCNEKSHLFNHMKYNLCKNSISLMSQKNSQAAKQVKATAKAVPPTPNSPGKPLNSPPEGDKDKEEADSVDIDVESDSPDSAAIVKSTPDKCLSRPSAFSLVTPSRDEAKSFKPSTELSEDQEAPAPAVTRPTFPWNAIDLKPFPTAVPEYSPYLLQERTPYPPFYVSGSHNEQIQPSISSNSQRPLVPQPIAPPHAPLFTPYPYRYGHPIHSGPPYEYIMYRPYELPMPLPGSRYPSVDLYGPTLGPYDFYVRSHHDSNSAATQEETSQRQSAQKETRLSPKEGCSALGSPDRPSQANVVPKDIEGSQYTNMDDTSSPRHHPTTDKSSQKDARLEDSAKSLLKLSRRSVVRGSTESGGHSCDSEWTSEQEDDNEDEMAPLNLSTRTHESQTNRPVSAQSKREEMPLNLSLRSSSPERLDDQLDEESCDQRQAAALALCQLAATSSTHHVNIKEVQLDLTTSRRLGETNNTTKEKGIKRTVSEQSKKSGHKPNKKAKVLGRATSKKPRC
ncbi:zinc finger protein 750 [Neosynchiropus ocellatus]